MKNVFAAALLALLMIFVGCTGDPGNDGAVYARYSLSSSVTRYWDDCSAALSNSYSRTSAGTYNFDFDAGTKRYYGTFTLTAYAGEKGGMFFKKGKDGADRYYTINVGSSSLWLSKAFDISRDRTGSPTKFDPELPILTRTDTFEGGTIVWRYQEKELK